MKTIHELNNYMMNMSGMTAKKVQPVKQPRTVNVTFRANYLMGTDYRIMTYTRTITASNAAGCIAALENAMFCDIQIISIK